MDSSSFYRFVLFAGAAHYFFQKVVQVFPKVFRKGSTKCFTGSLQQNVLFQRIGYGGNNGQKRSDRLYFLVEWLADEIMPHGVQKKVKNFLCLVDQIGHAAIFCKK